MLGYRDLWAKCGTIGKSIVREINIGFNTGGHRGGFFVGFNERSSGGLRIEDGQPDGGIDAGFNGGFDNGFFEGSNEGFDGR